MSKFRLDLARRAGERIARESGADQFPIDPFEIAEKEGINVQPVKMGTSGCIVFNDDTPLILYSTSISNIGFQRFTIAHELGHYYLDGHADEIMKLGGRHESSSDFSKGDSSIEIEADHFASGLLMPTKLSRTTIENAQVGLEGIIELAEKAQTSVTSAAIRAAECSPYPMAIVVSQGSEICYGFMSANFKALGKLAFPRKGDALPTSATRQFNQSKDSHSYSEPRCYETDLSVWFDGSAAVSLDEEILGLGSYGRTLTVLSSEQLPSDPDDYDEDEEDRGLGDEPKFAYGR